MIGPIARRGPRRHRRRDRRARPELVPHGRLPEPARRGRRGRGAPAGRPVDAALRRSRRATSLAGRRRPAPSDRRARRRPAVGAPSILVIASGADRTAGRELVLKIEEGRVAPGRLPRPRDVPARPPRRDRTTATGLVLILADRDRRAERLARAPGALAAARGHRDGRGGDRRRRCRRRPADRPRPRPGRIVIPEAPDAPRARSRRCSGPRRRSSC